MSPQFKTFLATLVFGLALYWMSTAVWAGDSFRLCMAEQHPKTLEVGCWTGSGVVAPKMWLKQVDKTCKFSDLEYIKDVKQRPILIKIHCKEEIDG